MNSSDFLILLCILLPFAFVAFSRNNKFENELSKSSGMPGPQLKNIGSICQTIPPITNAFQFFDLLDDVPQGVHCTNMTSVGGHLVKDGFLDGDKQVCFDPGFEFDSNECTVLSFGVNDDISFDIFMNENLGCQVFAFDPTIKDSLFSRARGINLFKLGISNFDGKIAIAHMDCKMDRYEGIIYRLGLEDQQINYLKMDIERTELDVFEDIFLNSPHLLGKVKQIGMEIHLGGLKDIANVNDKMSFIFRQWKLIHNLQCFGFKLAYANKNRVPGNHLTLQGRNISGAYELLWLKK